MIAIVLRRGAAVAVIALGVAAACGVRAPPRPPLPPGATEGAAAGAPPRPQGAAGARSPNDGGGDEGAPASGPPAEPTSGAARVPAPGTVPGGDAGAPDGR